MEAPQQGDAFDGTELAIHDKIIWASDFQWRPTWNYEVDDDAEICGLLTGCTEVDGIEAPETYEVVTVFASEIEMLSDAAHVA